MKRPEDAIQEAVVAHLRERGVKGVVWWHTPNGAVLGGKNKFAQVKALKKRGWLPGVFDLLLFHRKKLFCLELKAPKGRPTEAQLEFRDSISRQGGYTCIAEGLDEALMALELWGLLRATA
jgi:hypothetical protein